MTEEAQKPAAAETPAPSAEEVTVVADVPLAPEKEAPPVPEPEPEVADKATVPVAVVAEEVVEAEAEKPKAVAEELKAIAQSVSFKEESYVVSELPEAQKKALDELKQLIQEALNKHEFTAPPEAKKEEKKAEEKKEEEKKEEEKKEEEVKKEEEEKKEEEKTEEKVEVKTEEKTEEKKTEEKEEEKKIEEKTEEKTEEPPKAEEVVVAVVVEKVTAVVDEDGAKTVEAIEETIVVAADEATSSAKAEEEEPKKAEEEKAAAAAADTDTDTATATVEAAAPEPAPEPEEVYIWGIPLLGDERSDVILLKFLRARDYKVKDAFAMIKNTVRWRKDFGIDSLIEEDLGSDWDKLVFTHGVDKKGHQVCYNVFGEFSSKELYQNTFGDEEKRSKFIKWRIQFLEKSIRKFDFNPTGISTIVQVFINVPWWYLAFNRMISPFLTQRTKSKFVFAGPSKSAETLFRYIAPEHVPVQYGGLSRDGDQEFTTSDPVTEITIKAATKHTVEIPVSESSVLVWEIRVVGWDVTYGAEFVPSTEGHYTVIVQKARKISPTEEPVISNSFKVGEPGKIVLTIDNQSSKKKKILYRSKTKASCE
ncbi:hypothetical protein TIFTF001_034637 [Ficus carica]|uniref:Uncharacterized protein n=1 Tax=Ficus carica TaxID=3494 RepID=A0AA88J8V1_FICCA|nr:hypothetical protein TIFTF001_034637 [Ficus carica]